jgi:phosphoribosylglycinamide formyltransferase 1
MMARSKTRTAVLISGHGSNLQALIDATVAPDYPAHITLVVSNKAGAYGLVRASDTGIATAVLDHTRYENREAFDAALHALLTRHQIQFVCLAGFMRVLTPGFVHLWQGRMINIHPSLLPKHKGLHTHQAALLAGDTQHGCTVHWVSAGVDEGEIIAQSAVDVLPGDTPESLAARVHTLEHVLYPHALQMALGTV